MSILFKIVKNIVNVKFFLLKSIADKSANTLLKSWNDFQH